MEFRNYAELAFKDGDLLTVPMLEETYRYPREFLHLAHAKLADGIVAGLDFEEREGSVFLTAGLVKAGGRYYALPQAENLDRWLVEHKPGDNAYREYWLYLSVSELPLSAAAEASFTTRSRLTLQLAAQVPERALRLGRWKYRQGEKLRLPCLRQGGADPFAEFTDLVHLQLLDADYAHPQGETTFHPLVFRAVRCYLEEKKSLSPYDFSLLQEIQNCGTVSLSALKAYVAAVKRKPCSSVKPAARSDLFAAVIECLQEVYNPIIYVNGTVAAPDKDHTRERESYAENKWWP